MEPKVKKGDLPQEKKEDIQIHFGNVKIIEIKLLEAINRQLSEILVILRDTKKS